MAIARLGDMVPQTGSHDLFGRVLLKVRKPLLKIKSVKLTLPFGGLVNGECSFHNSLRPSYISIEIEEGPNK